MARATHLPDISSSRRGKPSTATDVPVVRRPTWIDPPDGWENLDLLNYVALPAIAGEAVILSFRIPQGRNGIIKKVGNNFVGGGWVEGSGDVTWSIQVDGAPPPGATSYDSILGSLGSPANPVEIAGFRVFENQLLTVEVNNIAIPVAGQLAGARLVGFLYPVESEDSEPWV